MRRAISLALLATLCSLPQYAAARVSQELTLAEGTESEVELELVATEKVEPHARKDGSAYPPPGTEHYR